ncbi:essential MCU regulator, mitochondrial-like [Pollicipes pollicipes]|uniref:essential MCU regulator, mitochondrial-like n=1 Tax=Pollicipes pollicipes TaxID=41117 RepID=UPI001885580E|nr:essential MCU regulator, mitochondrial-like [Pollicipes pollicipes]XP_037094126.1 essential MCU regulator, mitochondrial-like [Pollicipes pollicipes]XP_037094313.1 essential MCU regulator, mitochondrial-like [Pollicipes pollicipes]
MTGRLGLLRTMGRARTAAAAAPPPRLQCRSRVTLATGALREEPPRNRLAVIGAFFTVLPGLLIGASISKNMASFLEENDLFVPADDDDDM